MDVISVHVPKTAGSTFQSMLTTVYGRERIFMDYDDVPMNPLSPYTVDPEGWRRSSSAQVRSIGPEILAVHGHFAVEKYGGVFPEARRIAWVRHPASWVISLYYFWKHAAPTTNPLLLRLQNEQISLDEFAQDPTARNRVSCTFLKGVPLDEFDFVGVQEHFDDDFRDLVLLMGWPEVPSRADNANPEPGYSALIRELHQDHRLIDRLVSLNEGDMALYEEALRLRARRVGPSQTRIDPPAMSARFHGDRRARTSAEIA
jgi:hypothetical protein